MDSKIFELIEICLGHREIAPGNEELVKIAEAANKEYHDVMKYTVCAYCGEKTDRDDAIGRANHIMTCEKRPEKKLMEKAFEIENDLYAKIIHLTSHTYAPEACTVCADIEKIVKIFMETDEVQKPDQTVS